MTRRKREVIFSAMVEYNQYENQKERHISRGSNISDISFDKLESEVRNLLCRDLPIDLDKLYGIKVDIRHIDSREGSLIVFFGAMITTYGFIANYKDFFESIRLIKKHGERLLESLMRRLRISDVNVDVSDEYPDLPHPDNVERNSRLRRLFYKFPPDIAEMILETETYGKYNRSNRDGFFWYLVVMNIILVVALAALVVAAVIKVYF